MASCQTTRWGTNNSSPYVKLTVTEKSSTGAASVLAWKLQYISAYAAQTDGVGREYTVTINGSAIKSGTYNINGVTGTHTIAEGTTTISKGTSSKTVTFKVSFEFYLSWSGIRRDVLEASGSISISAKTSYAVSYNANGGSNVPSNQTKWYDVPLALSSTKPTRTGYTFQGWGTSASTTTVSYASGAKYTKNAAVTLYAVWKANTYTVSYNANGGSGAPSSQTKTHGKDLALSSTKPTRTGYTFQGWGTSASTTTVSYASGAKYTKNAAVTLYAVWKANTYTISYNVNGGVGNIANTTKTHGVSAKLTTSEPTRTNYSFLGWSESKSATSATYASGATYTKNGNATLYAVWKLSYTKPKISSLSVQRCNADKTLNESGTYALVNFSWSTFIDVSKVLIEWLQKSTIKGSTSPTVSGKSGSINMVVGSGNLSTEITYSIRVTVTDSSGSTTVTKTLNGIKFPIDIKAKGKGIAFGKVADLDDYVDFGFATKHRYNAEFDYGKRIYGYSSSGEKVEVFYPQNSSNNLVVGFGNYERKNGNTNIYGHDVHLGISNVDNVGSDGIGALFRPYFRKGDTFTVDIDTAGYVTGSGKSIRFTIPCCKPIIGNPVITAQSINGFRFRQNNSYPYDGGGSENWVTPSSYTATFNSDLGLIVIVATMNNDTKVTNNSTIGIDWSGRIKFS